MNRYAKVTPSIARKPGAALDQREQHMQRRGEHRLRVGDVRPAREDVRRPERRLAGRERARHELDRRQEGRLRVVGHRDGAGEPRPCRNEKRDREDRDDGERASLRGGHRIRPPRASHRIRRSSRSAAWRVASLHSRIDIGARAGRVGERRIVEALRHLVGAAHQLRGALDARGVVARERGLDIVDGPRGSAPAPCRPRSPCWRPAPSIGSVGCAASPSSVDAAAREARQRLAAEQRPFVGLSRCCG